MDASSSTESRASSTQTSRPQSAVPFLDVAAPYRELRSEVDAELRAIFDSAGFAQGKRVARFEAEFAAYCGSEHAIAVSSGTDALTIALRALELKPGDEVITTAFSFVATAEAIALAGGTPVFVDVDPVTLQMDPSGLGEALSEHTVGILPVHIHGAMANMAEILNFALERELWVLEDACQAHGATWQGQRAGSLGDLGCFSFYPGKNLGTCGEGGMIVTDDAVLAEEARLFRDHGAAKKYEHVQLGSNSRMSEIEAAMLSIKLPHLNRWNAQRRELAQLYRRELAYLPLELACEYEGSEPVHHIFAIRCEQREALSEHLNAQGIQTGIHYPHPLHMLTAVGGSSEALGTMPVAEDVTRTTLSLPMFPELGAQRVLQVSQAIRDFLEPRPALPSR